MDALIICAGRGRRLKPITDVIPKPLVQIHQKNLLERVLEQLVFFNVKNVHIVVGYKKEQIKKNIGDRFSELKINYIHNPFYNKLNNLFSVWLCKPHLYGKKFILINGDIIFDKIILKTVLNSNLNNFSVIDTTKPIPEDSMKVRIKNNVLVDFGKKIKNPEGYTMGIHKFSKDGSKIFLTEIEEMLENGTDDYHHGAILNSLKKQKLIHHALIIKNVAWCEIDEIMDISKASNMFNT
ncbi:phosphocholine cytidylyltransferase family protein [Candidatus Woesearchaeota archaeon]|jgi:L-glutamine-phosphate cytidylyltransferase|nr:phosphocholine cytidylyltransferase family protein [Candidatus Woesearchaeota archaeon]